MEKNKMFYITLVLVVCVVFTGIGCFYLGTKFGEKQDNVDNKEVINNKKDNNKEEVKELTKAEKDALVKNEVDKFAKLLNNDDGTRSSNLCWHFSVDGWNIYNYKELLSDFASSLMACQYGLKYVEVDDWSLISPKAYLMTEDMYKEFQEYFNSSIQNTTIIDGVFYYIAAIDGDGYGVREYNFELNDNITENDGVYTATFNLYENPLAYGSSEDDIKLAGKTELKLTIKNNHIYYLSFNVVNV